MINNQIYISSVNKALNKSKVYGYLNLRRLQLFNLYRYYIQFTDEIKELGYDGFNDHNFVLKQEIANLKYKYPEELCLYKTILPDNLPDSTNDNLPPASADKTINIELSESYTLTVGDFVENFTDPNGDGYRYLIIYPDGLNGELNNNSTTLVNPITINIEGDALTEELPIIYNREDDNSFVSDQFKFRVSDNHQNYLYSPLYTITFMGDQISTNQPPNDIGDNTIYVDNRVTTVLTLEMFTTQLKLPYSDPENDLIDAIKIIDISNANIGTFYLDGVEIVDNQIITREDINSGLFTHVAADQDAISSDVFEFQARDEGSLIWVE